MKALSLWQPWASLIAIGAKKIETRSWSTYYRGPLVIHAAKSVVGIENTVREMYGDNLNFPNRDPHCFARLAFSAFVGVYSEPFKFRELPLGAALCFVELVDCVPTETITDISRAERAFGNYAPGRFAWILKDLQCFDAPVPIKGGQRLWNYDYINSSESTAVAMREARAQGRHC